MKKYILCLLFSGLISASMAQTPGMMQRRMLPGKIDTLLINYLSYSKFSSLDDVGFSEAVANQFKFLFAPGAHITDEVNPSYYDQNYDHAFDLPIRTVDEYVAKTKENYPAGLFVKFNAIQADYAAGKIVLLKETNGTTKGGILYKVIDTIRLNLDISADFKSVKIADVIVMGYTIALVNDDDRDFVANELDKCPKEQGLRTPTGCFTKEEKVAFAAAEKERKRREKEALAQNDGKDAAAKAEAERKRKEKEALDKANAEKEALAKAEAERIRKEKEAQDAANAGQTDAAKAEQERIRKEKEAIAQQEKHERDSIEQKRKEDAALAKENKKKEKPAEPAQPGLFIGVMVSAGNNNFKSAFAENNLGYDKLLKGNKSVYSITPLKLDKRAPFTQFQLDVDYFFGSKKKFGIATGLGVSSFNATFAMDSFHVEYRSTDSRGETYRRVLHVRAIDEHLKVSTINIPIMLQYKFGLGDKANICVGLGVNYFNVRKANVSGSGVADYEAIYNYGSGSSTATFDEGVPPDRNSWLITRSNVEAHNGKAGEQAYFTQKRADGYDVAIDQAISRTDELSLSGGLGRILRVNANFMLSEKLWFATMLQFQGVSMKNGSYSNNYKLTDEIGTYNFLLNNSATLKASSVALGIGLKYTIK
jgi:hypothetical protein